MTMRILPTLGGSWRSVTCRASMPTIAKSMAITKGPSITALANPWGRDLAGKILVSDCSL